MWTFKIYLFFSLDFFLSCVIHVLCFLGFCKVMILSFKMFREL